MAMYPYWENDNTNLDLEYSDLNMYFNWCISTNGRFVYFENSESCDRYEYPLPTIWTEDAIKLLDEVKHFRTQYLKTIKLSRCIAASASQAEYLDEVVNVEDLNIKTYNREDDSDDMEDTGFQYDLTATYEVNYSDMSDGYDNYDTYKFKLKLESEDPDFIEQPELELDLTMHNKGKLESLLKLINTIFYLGQNNSANCLSIDAKSIETSDLEL